MQWIGPTHIYDSNESNNSSLIVSINYSDTNYLFMGDSQNNRIKDYLNQHNNEYDFIKIPYHGNYQKRLDDLLDWAKPKYAVITCSSSESDISETIFLFSTNGGRTVILLENFSPVLGLMAVII